MYPDVTYHFFIDASIEERTNRKYMQYNKEIQKELEYVEKTTTVNMYLNDLNQLLKDDSMDEFKN